MLDMFQSWLNSLSFEVRLIIGLSGMLWGPFLGLYLYNYTLRNWDRVYDLLYKRRSGSNASGPRKKRYEVLKSKAIEEGMKLDQKLV